MKQTAVERIVITVTAMLLCCSLAMAGELTTFRDEDRQAIDARVLALPDLRTEKPDKAFYGTLAGWGIERTPLTPEEELNLAKAEHQKVLQTHDTSLAPELANRVIKRLSAHLPGVAPKEFEYTLTIIETNGFQAWTVGGGFLYLSRPMYEALTKNEDHAEDRLAFVLANEIGHIVRKHCRRGYQLIKLEDFAKKEGWDKADVSKLKTTIGQVVDLTGNVLRFLYKTDEEYQADLFAADLCRNAGFDVEAGFDVLRQGVVTEEQGGNLSDDPAQALISKDNPSQKQKQPSARQRLQQLCFDRDGVIRGDQYGLWEFDRESKQWIKPKTLRAARGEKVVLMVHGMDSSLTTCQLDLAKALANDESFREHRLLGFQYPGDASLSRAGMFLHREVSDALDPSIRPDFVCHSAGGLVARYHCEVLGGAYRRLIMQGTPQAGSDLAELRPVVEMKQFVSSLEAGYSEALENVILDGQGQIAFDLEPSSLFLTYLNQKRVDRSRYAILRGRKFGRFEILLLERGVELGRRLLIRQMETSKAPKIVRERAMESLEKLHLPEEVRDGDLIVSTTSASLEGVSNVQTFEMHHGELAHDPAAIAAVIAILKSEP